MINIASSLIQLLAAITASALFMATAFNYGFFQTIGLEFFYLLSVQDFFKSLVSIWYLVAISVLYLMTFSSFYRRYRLNRANNNGFQPTSRNIVLLSFLILLCIVIYVSMLFVFDLFRFIAFFVFTVFFTLFMQFASANSDRLKKDTYIFFIVPMIFAATLVMAWEIGKERAQSIFDDNVRMYELDLSTGPGQFHVVRFLDAGILLRDNAERRVVYVPWDKVGSVRSGEVPPRPEPALKPWW